MIDNPDDPVPDTADCFIAVPTRIAISVLTLISSFELSKIRSESATHSSRLSKSVGIRFIAIESALTDFTILGMVFLTLLMSLPMQYTFASPKDAKIPAMFAPMVPVTPITVTVFIFI